MSLGLAEKRYCRDDFASVIRIEFGLENSAGWRVNELRERKREEGRSDPEPKSNI